jgi:hypothetical protein
MIGTLTLELVTNMATHFQVPEFIDGQLEIRIDAEGVAIYGTRDGLNALATICIKLATRSLGRDGTAHVHLEDHALLTIKSVNTAVAVFERSV